MHAIFCMTAIQSAVVIDDPLDQIWQTTNVTKAWSSVFLIPSYKVAS